MSETFCRINSQHIKNNAQSGIGLTFFYSGIEKCAPNHYWLGIRDHFILHFILEGRGKCIFGTETYKLAKGQAFLVRPGQRVHYTADPKSPWKYCWVAFSGIQAESLIGYTDFSDSKSITGFNNSKEVESTITNLESIDINQSNQYSLSLSHLLFMFSCLTAKSTQVTNKHGIKGRYLDIAKNFIDRNYSRNIKVESIAKHVGVNRKYLNEIFKEYQNVTTQQYLLNKRMDQATILLSSTTLSIKEIAHSVGYYDALLFSKMFKRKYGISPNGFRERM